MSATKSEAGREHPDLFHTSTKNGMSPDQTQPLEGALFAVNMLAGTEGGRTYTFEEVEADLLAAGFSKIRPIQRKGMFSLVEGYKS